MTPPVIQGPLLHRSAICETVLRALQQRFGLETAIQPYVREADHLPTFTALMEGQTVGFLTL